MSGPRTPAARPGTTLTAPGGLYRSPLQLSLAARIAPARTRDFRPGWRRAGPEGAGVPFGHDRGKLGLPVRFRVGPRGRARVLDLHGRIAIRLVVSGLLSGRGNGDEDTPG